MIFRRLGLVDCSGFVVLTYLHDGQKYLDLAFLLFLEDLSPLLPFELVFLRLNFLLLARALLYVGFISLCFRMLLSFALRMLQRCSLVATSLFKSAGVVGGEGELWIL